MIQQLREESDHLRHELSHPGHQADKFRKWLRYPDVRLVLSLVGGTVVWGLYFSSLHALNSLTCRFGWFGAPAASGGLKLVQIAVTVLALALVTAAGYNAYNLWRVTRKANTDAIGDSGDSGDSGVPGNLEQTVAAYTPFAAFVLILLNSLYFLIILVSLAPIATLTTCGG